PIAHESDLTRLVRTLLQALKRQLLANTTTPIAIDYREKDSAAVPIAKVPSLVLLGPSVRENRIYATNELEERVVQTATGPEIERRRPAFAADLHFAITGVTNRTTEFLNFAVGLVTFFHRNPYLWIARDPNEAGAGAVRFEMAPTGELQSALEGQDDLRAMRWAFVVHGFPIDDAWTLDLGRGLTGGVTTRMTALK